MMRGAIAWGYYAVGLVLIGVATYFLAGAGAFAQEADAPIATDVEKAVVDQGLVSTHFDGPVLDEVIKAIVAYAGPPPWGEADKPVAAILISNPARMDVASVTLVQADGTTCHNITIRSTLAQSGIVFVRGRAA